MGNLHFKIPQINSIKCLSLLFLSTDCGAHTVLSVGEGKMCNKLNHLMNFLTMWSPRHIYS